MKHRKNQKFCAMWVNPKTVSEPYPDPPKNKLGLQKVKSDFKIKSKSKVRSERIIENESCSSTWVDPKTVFKPYHNPKSSPVGVSPKKWPKN